MWFVFLFLLLVKPAIADEKTDYLYQYDLYNQSYQVYNEKKQINLKYNTIATQKELFTATINSINARNFALKTYLIALQIDLNKYIALDTESTQKLQNELLKWENWLESQQKVVNNINSDQDLKKWAELFQQKYPQIQNAIYSALSQNEINLRLQTLSKIQLLASNIKVDPKIKPQSLQWLDSLTSKSEKITKNLQNAKAIYQKNLDQQKFTNFYPDIKFEINSATSTLKEATNDLKLTIVKFVIP